MSDEPSISEVTVMVSRMTCSIPSVSEESVVAAFWDLQEIKNAEARISQSVQDFIMECQRYVFTSLNAFEATFLMKGKTAGKFPPFSLSKVPVASGLN